MPPHNLLKDALTLLFNNISMTRNNPSETPLIDPLDTSREALPVTRTRAIPNRALLPLRIALCILQGREDLGQDAAIRIDTRFAELLCSR